MVCLGSTGWFVSYVFEKEHTAFTPVYNCFIFV